MKHSFMVGAALVAGLGVQSCRSEGLRPASSVQAVIRGPAQVTLGCSLADLTTYFADGSTPATGLDRYIWRVDGTEAGRERTLVVAWTPGSHQLALRVEGGAGTADTTLRVEVASPAAASCLAALVLIARPGLILRGNDSVPARVIAPAAITIDSIRWVLDATAFTTTGRVARLAVASVGTHTITATVFASGQSKDLSAKVVARTGDPIGGPGKLVFWRRTLNALESELRFMDGETGEVTAPIATFDLARERDSHCDGERILFGMLTSNSQAGFDLYTVDHEGHGFRALIRGPGGKYTPFIRGNLVVYADNARGPSELALSRLDGQSWYVSGSTRNADYLASTATLSPDGTEIAFGGPNSRLWLMPSSGGAPRVLHAQPLEQLYGTGKTGIQEGLGAVAYSPDGSRLYYVVSWAPYAISDIYSSAVTGDDVRLVTQGVGPLRVSPDGAYLVFMREDIKMYSRNLSSGVELDLSSIAPIARSNYYPVGYCGDW